MKTPSASQFSKVLFIVSAGVLMFLYGYGTRSFGWFPNRQIEQAWEQARPFVEAARGGFSRYPQIYERRGLTVSDSSSVQRGQMLTSVSVDGEPVVSLMDTDTDVLHRWELDPTEIFPETFTSFLGVNRFSSLAVSHLDSAGNILARVSHGPAARLDACGNVLWRLSGEFHHQTSRAEDGTYWLINEVTERPDHPGLRDLEDAIQHSHDLVRHDELVHVSPDGEVLKRIDLIDVLFENGLERYVADFLEWTNDLNHANDVEPLPASLAESYPLFDAGDLVVSLRTPSLVFVLDPDTGRVKWHSSEHWLRQHDPDFIGNGWIGVFDNRWDGTLRGEMLGGSRIVAVQPHTDSVEVLYPKDDSVLFHAPVGGEWQMLDNGNLLLVQGVYDRVAQVSSDGRTVWEWIGEAGDVSEIGLRGVSRVYDLSEEDVESWSCD